MLISDDELAYFYFYFRLSLRLPVYNIFFNQNSLHS